MQLGEATTVRVGNDDVPVHFLEVKTKCLRFMAAVSEAPLRFDRHPESRQLMVDYKDDATESEAEVSQRSPATTSGSLNLEKKKMARSTALYA